MGNNLWAIGGDHQVRLHSRDLLDIFELVNIDAHAQLSINKPCNALPLMSCKEAPTNVTYIILILHRLFSCIDICLQVRRGGAHPCAGGHVREPEVESHRRFRPEPPAHRSSKLQHHRRHNCEAKERRQAALNGLAVGVGVVR